MEPNDKIVNKYIDDFFTRIAGFKKQEVKYTSMSSNNKEFLSIAMDKVDRLTRQSGRLRHRVWSNCYFIFHSNETKPSEIYQHKVAEIKENYAFLFIRSYVYFIFVNFSEEKKHLLPFVKEQYIKPKNEDYKIWFFNKKYELSRVGDRTNIFGITLHENEIIDDYVYLANPVSELERMKAANSDVIDCIRAFTGDLELLEQTSEMLKKARNELNNNPKARILLEGPARSGKTIIAATLLGEYDDSKFLLMNYYFYQAIVDGFHALSGWTKEEIEILVSNPELDNLLQLKNAISNFLKNISRHLEVAISEYDQEPDQKKFNKKNLMDNINYLFKKITDLESTKLKFEHENFPILKQLNDLLLQLKTSTSANPFIDIDKNFLQAIKNKIDRILSGKYDDLDNFLDSIVKGINNLVRDSRQRFFHHNINTKISAKIKDSCWIKRGKKTSSKMWTDDYHPKLIICDEVQRLGIIPEYGNYDEFNEIEQILAHSEQSFLTGDDFQMLNWKYDQGIKQIDTEITKRDELLIKFQLPEAVGVPAEVGILMKYLTNPQAVEIDEVVNNWQVERDFELIFIEQNANNLIELLDDDKSNKKHLASPIDYRWLGYNETINIETLHRATPINPIKNHEKANFVYRFPYFCNEEIMSNYILSAYELISREVESLYIHIPKFEKGQPNHDKWYQKHLYVLFTRPTIRLVVNFDNKDDFFEMETLCTSLTEKGAKIPITFLTNYS